MPAVRNALSYLALAAVVIANVAGNIFMKIGSSSPPREAIFFGVFGWQTALGITCFASGVLFYAFALRTLPLYAAQSVVILQFAGVMLSAALFFRENISPLQWTGIFLILTGLTLVIRQL